MHGLGNNNLQVPAIHWRQPTRHYASQRRRWSRARLLFIVIIWPFGRPEREPDRERASGRSPKAPQHKGARARWRRQPKQLARKSLESPFVGRVPGALCYASSCRFCIAGPRASRAFIIHVVGASVHSMLARPGPQISAASSRSIAAGHRLGAPKSHAWAHLDAGGRPFVLSAARPARPPGARPKLGLVGRRSNSRCELNRKRSQLWRGPS